MFDDAEDEAPPVIVGVIPVDAVMTLGPIRLVSAVDDVVTFS